MKVKVYSCGNLALIHILGKYTHFANCSPTVEIVRTRVKYIWFSQVNYLQCNIKASLKSSYAFKVSSSGPYSKSPKNTATRMAGITTHSIPKQDFP